MAWRIRVKTTGKHLVDDGVICEFETEEECRRAIRSYESGKFVAFAGLLEPEKF